jgi:hypothetical protein
MTFCGGGRSRMRAALDFEKQSKKTRQKTNSENHGLVPVEQHAIFHMPADSPREHDFFEVAPLADEVIDGIAV